MKRSQAQFVALLVSAFLSVSVAEGGGTITVRGLAPEVRQSDLIVTGRLTEFEIAREQKGEQFEVRTLMRGRLEVEGVLKGELEKKAEPLDITFGGAYLVTVDGKKFPLRHASAVNEVRNIAVGDRGLWFLQRHRGRYHATLFSSVDQVQRAWENAGDEPPTAEAALAKLSRQIAMYLALVSLQDALGTLEKTFRSSKKAPERLARVQQLFAAYELSAWTLLADAPPKNRLSREAFDRESLAPYRSRVKKQVDRLTP